MASKRKTKTSRSRSRRGLVKRETSETSISVGVGLDGPPSYSVDTGIPFFDHMLETLGRHSFMSLKVKAHGDTEIDDHHTVEDVGIAMGQAIDKALGDRKGIVRFGHAEVPLDEALVAVTVDLSGRPFLVYNLKVRHHRVGNFEIELVNDFMQALMNGAGMNLHINKRYGRNPHHIVEAAFKALARALAMAVAVDPRVKGVPSTKGTLKG
ncbi:MAG: imidazoleglycerol-phosphate dehydratase HisB [Deltaproteobacteria bacterium]